MTLDVVIRVDDDTAAVLLDWLQREAAIDDYKWVSARPGQRVALKRLLDAARNATKDIDVTEAQERLEATLPPPPTHSALEEIPDDAPRHVRRRLRLAPPASNLVSRVAYRLDMLGVSHTGVAWKTDDEHGYLEVGLDPYSEDTAHRIRLMCDPVAVRFVEGPYRPQPQFG